MMRIVTTFFLKLSAINSRNLAQLYYASLNGNITSRKLTIFNNPSFASQDQEHLKPPIVGGLANAELYCLALANMYSDPNYHSLNHWNILQTLARKGVHVPDPPDIALTETVLIQTNPLRMVSITYDV